MAAEATKPTESPEAVEAFLADPVLQDLASLAAVGGPGRFEAVEAMAARIAWHVATGLVTVERGRAAKDLLNVALSGRPPAPRQPRAPQESPESPETTPSWESAISEGESSAPSAGGNGRASI
jgi:hypothetical protein